MIEPHHQSASEHHNFWTTATNESWIYEEIKSRL